MKYVDYDIVFQEIPDETTLAINISNCPFRCEGCHSPHLRDDIGEELDYHKLLELTDKYPDITCICFMGGSWREISSLIWKYVLYNDDKQYKFAWYTGSDKMPEEWSVNGYIGMVLLNYVKIGSYKGIPINDPNTNQRLYQILFVGETEPSVYYGDITYKFWK